MLGTAADLSGALLMILAFAHAPVSLHAEACINAVAVADVSYRWIQVSVVQPVSAVGLVVLLIFSHFYLQVRWLTLQPVLEGPPLRPSV